MSKNKSEFPLASRGETLPASTENRVVVLGSRISGAFQLGEALQAYLKQQGISGPKVEVLRNAGKIEEAILGRETVEEGRNNPPICPEELFCFRR